MINTSQLAPQLICVKMQHSKSCVRGLQSSPCIADLVRIETYVAGTVIMSVGDTLSGRHHIKREDAAMHRGDRKATLISLLEVGALLTNYKLIHFSLILLLAGDH